MTQYHLRDDITPEELNSALADWLQCEGYNNALDGLRRALFREVETEGFAEMDALPRQVLSNLSPFAPTPPAESGPLDYMTMKCDRLKEENTALRATVERLEGESGPLDYMTQKCDRLKEENAALRAEVARLKARDTQWVEFAYAVGQQVNCLYSVSPDSNGHIIEAVSRLREDGERLDWLQSLARYQTFPDGGSITHFATKDVHAALHASGGNLRAAIDAARSTPEGDNG